MILCAYFRASKSEECGEYTETTDKRYFHLPCHYKCGTAARTLKNKANKGGDKKQTAALKKMRAEGPEELPQNYQAPGFRR